MNLSSAIIKLVSRAAVGALIRAIVVWFIVFGLAYQLLQSFTMDMDIQLASIFSFIFFVGMFFSEWKRSLPARH